MVSHFLLVVATAIALMLHILPARIEIWIFPAVAARLWIFNFVFRFRRIWKVEQSKAVSITKLKGLSVTHDVVRLVVELIEPVLVRSGQYAYLNFRSLWIRDRIQTHPFMVAWWGNTSVKNNVIVAKQVTFLIEAQEGLTRRMGYAHSPFQCQLLVGPYGGTYVEKYDNVILVGEGIGIAGILSYAKELILMKSLLSHKNQVLTRKLDIYWKLQSNDQQEWVGDYFKQIQRENNWVYILLVDM